MKSIWIGIVSTAIFAVGGCSKSPEDATRALRANGIPPTESGFRAVIVNGDIESVELFLAALGHNANVSLSDCRSCLTSRPLDIAAEAGQHEVVQLLLNAGATPHSKALELARTGEVVRTLIAAGVPLDSTDRAFAVAARFRRADVFDALLGAGIRPTQSAVYAALSIGILHADGLTMLLDAGLEPSKDLLWEFSDGGQLELIPILINAGVEPDSDICSGSFSVRVKRLLEPHCESNGSIAGRD